ncbi:MAG: NUDIX domain-containing protein [Cyanobacteria bacterium]|nr:NUDIX domain-containing protein [Cyanobacteriota bacterium]
MSEARDFIENRLELSAGAALVRRADTGLELLLIRVRAHAFELPKGHIEENEQADQTAARELREETGLLSSLLVGPELDSVEYAFATSDGVAIEKRVRYFLFLPKDQLVFGRKPERTREIRWIGELETEDVSLVNEKLRDVIVSAFATAGGADV